MSGVELREVGAILEGEERILPRRCRGLEAENRVEWSGSDGSVHILSVQLLPMATLASWTAMLLRKRST